MQLMQFAILLKKARNKMNIMAIIDLTAKKAIMG
jgi:hypothetical protein